MSHFLVAVILPKGSKDVENTVTELLAPFDEQLEVPEYKRPCLCIEDIPDPICKTCNGSGIELTTCNPQSKWDSWVIGGRWDAGKNIKLCSEMVEPFAIVTPEGEWIEKGEMGWWAIVSNEKSNWDVIYKEVFKKYAGYQAAMVDCHI